jgi:hypothetical protein
MRKYAPRAPAGTVAVCVSPSAVKSVDPFA